MGQAPEVEGWPELVNRIGASPAFADAAILDFGLTLAGDASLVLRTFAMSDGANYDYERPIIVTVSASRVQAVELQDFGPAAYVDELRIERSGDLWRLSLQAAAGLCGSLLAKDIKVGSRPG